MPIGAWVAPIVGNFNNTNNPDFINIKQYQQLANSKINTIYALYENAESYLPKVLEALDYANQFNIGYLVRDSRIMLAKSKTELLDIIKPYYQKPSFVGVLAIDEPGIIHFPLLGKIHQWFKELCPNDVFYINLLPTYATKVQLINGAAGGEVILDNVNYELYISEYIKQVKPEFISYDFYALEGPFPSLKDGYFEQLSIIRKYALSNSIPYWNFVQCCSFNSHTRIPNKIELNWQVNTSLSYGVKGIQYFTYFLPLEIEAENFKGSIIDSKGKPTKIYDDIIVINDFIEKIDEYIMPSIHLGIMPSDDIQSLFAKNDLFNPTIINKFTGVNGLIGCFKKSKDLILLLVNNSIELKEPTTYNLEFNNVYEFKVITQSCNNVYKTNKLTLSVASGDAILICLKEIYKEGL